MTNQNQQQDDANRRPGIPLSRISLAIVIAIAVNVFLMTLVIGGCGLKL